MPVIVISPLNVINFLEGGGHFWVYMQYAQGLRELGCEVFWLEGFRRHASAAEDELVLAAFHERMKRFGLSGKTIVYPTTQANGSGAVPDQYYGMSRVEAEAIFAEADLLLNFHYSAPQELLARFRRTALVDIDPGLLQFWITRGQLRVAPHDFYFTTGETVGTPAARIPDCGLRWIRIHPPVSLRCWPCVFDPAAKAFSTVSNWDADDWIVDSVETYENTKRVAFLEFADLPRLTRQPLELALFLKTQKDAQERSDLERRGWRIRLSPEVAGTPESYQQYIQRSRGEFSCAKPSYVKFQNAWVSDRTLCYLASGKPAVVQNTGPSAFLPDNEGLFRFTTLRQAADALEKLNEDYEHNCQVARQIAEAHFDAKRVVADLVSNVLN